MSYFRGSWDEVIDAVPSDELQAAIDKIELAQSKLDAIQRFIDAQAEDEGLWCEAECVSEAYIQKGLRGCHAFVESVIKDGPRPETTVGSHRMVSN